MLPLEYYSRYANALAILPDSVGGKYRREDLSCSQFHIFSDRGLDVYYAPFHHVERNARVALIGLTPGFTQMEEAFRAAKAGARAGLTGADLFSYIDRIGSFSGPMRTNLVRMLDGIGLNAWLDIATTEHMFADQSGLVHFTSAVSAPIFKGGQNYNGSLVRVPFLREWILKNLASEIAMIPLTALLIPLGKGASEALELLARVGRVSLDRCLFGFPHPSGANGHARSMFEAGKQSWKAQLDRL